MRKFFDSLGKVFGDSDSLTPTDILPKLTSITVKGRHRLLAQLELEARIDGAAAGADMDALEAYLHALAATGEAVKALRISAERLRVEAHAFVGDISADGEGWLLCGRFRDSGRDDRFATVADLIWGGLVLTGRPSVHIQRLYEVQRKR